MTTVFLDTVGMIANWDDADQWHADAQKAFAKLLNEGCRVVTTPLVLYECGNASARRTYRSDVCELRQFLMDEKLLIEPTPKEIEIAWSEYQRGTPGQAGIVDHVSFLIMRRLGIAEAFTNDKHFEAAGFKALF